MPKVSVLLSSYNHANYLKKSIDSILNQTYSDFELIIVDDCSSDNSWNVIKSYKDKRIRKIRHKTNKGSILTRELVESFNGEYFAVAHCDDYWEKTKLEKQVKFLEKHLEIAACFTYVKLVDENDNEIGDVVYTNFNVENRSRFEWLNYFFYYGNCLCHPSILIRKSVQLKCNLFSYALKSLPDFYRWVKLCLYYDIYIYPEKLTNFRIRRGGLNTSGYRYDNIVRCTFEITKILELYEKLDDESFVKVFPQSKMYQKDNYFSSSFALARICIDEIGSKPYIDFGLHLIYQLFQDEKNRKNMIEKYNYTTKNFTDETGGLDIFNSIDDNLIQYSSIYFANEGEDYSEKRKISTQTLIRQNGDFEILFSDLNESVVCFRIDPDDRMYRCYSDIRIFVNGNGVKFSSNCTFIDNNKMFFLHKDPIFFVEFTGIINDIYVTGKTEIVSTEDVIQYHEITLKKVIEENKFSFKVRRKINFYIDKIKFFKD